MRCFTPKFGVVRLESELNMKVELNDKSNLLEYDTYKFKLQDVEEPNLYREIFPYTEVPKTPFNYRRVPMDMPEKSVSQILPSVTVCSPRLLTALSR